MQKVFAVYDAKSCAFQRLFHHPTAGLATRGFVDVMRQKGNPFIEHPEDYSLWELGTYDPNTGVIASYDKPVQLMTASQAIEQARIGTNAEVVS